MEDDFRFFCTCWLFERTFNFLGSEVGLGKQVNPEVQNIRSMKHLLNPGQRKCMSEEPSKSMTLGQYAALNSLFSTELSGLKRPWKDFLWSLTLRDKPVVAPVLHLTYHFESTKKAVAIYSYVVKLRLGFHEIIDKRIIVVFPPIQYYQKETFWKAHYLQGCNQNIFLLLFYVIFQTICFYLKQTNTKNAWKLCIFIYYQSKSQSTIAISCFQYHLLLFKWFLTLEIHTG